MQPPVFFRKKQFLFALVWTALSATSAAAASITAGAFVSPSVTTFDGLGLPFFNDSPLTVQGNKITTLGGTIRYFTSTTCTNECIGTDGDTDTLDILLAAPSVRVGLLVGLSGADVSFFDPNNVKLGTVSVSGNGTDAAFAGWDAGLTTISSVEVVDTEANSRVVSVDDLTVEGTPEPGTWLTLLGGLAALPILKARRR